MSIDELVIGWLKRAKSNLDRAKNGKTTVDIMYEDLCYDCQQTVEKSIKALLIHHNITFPKIHSITQLLNLIEQLNIVVPEEIKETVLLNNYAVETRYPGDYEPIEENEYKKALDLAEKTYNWINSLIKSK